MHFNYCRITSEYDETNIKKHRLMKYCCRIDIKTVTLVKRSRTNTRIIGISMRFQLYYSNILPQQRKSLYISIQRMFEGIRYKY